jgi:NAD-dependent SIR2 family protein deacetylase
LKEASMKKFSKAVEEGEILKCESCEEYVKPDIVFFGEQLPNSFFRGI